MSGTERRDPWLLSLIVDSGRVLWSSGDCVARRPLMPEEPSEVVLCCRVSEESLSGRTAASCALGHTNPCCLDREQRRVHNALRASDRRLCVTATSRQPTPLPPILHTLRQKFVRVCAVDVVGFVSKCGVHPSSRPHYMLSMQPEYPITCCQCFVLVLQQQSPPDRECCRPVFITTHGSLSEREGCKICATHLSRPAPVWAPSN